MIHLITNSSHMRSLTPQSTVCHTTIHGLSHNMHVLSTFFILQTYMVSQGTSRRAEPL
jgi:hypothetical protein